MPNSGPNYHSSTLAVVNSLLLMYYVPLKTLESMEKEETGLCEFFFGLDGTLVMPDPHPGALPCLPNGVM